MIFCTVFPFLVVYFLYRNWELIVTGDEEFEQRFGALWEGIKIDDTVEGYAPLTYIFFFMFRRFLLGVFAVIFKNYFCFQIAGMVLSSVVATIIVGYSRPLESRRDNDLEYFNETAIMFILYTAILFSDFVPSEDIRY
jgi:hypothetical protein